jgi:hypothetical protein
MAIAAEAMPLVRPVWAAREGREARPDVATATDAGQGTPRRSCIPHNESWNGSATESWRVQHRRDPADVPGIEPGDVVLTYGGDEAGEYLKVVRNGAVVPGSSLTPSGGLARSRDHVVFGNRDPPPALTAPADEMRLGRPWLSRTSR